MIVRRPLPPCSTANQSIARSQICQNGEAQRPATKPQLIRCTPPSSTFMISRWPSTRTTSTRPESRMKIHEYISKVLRRRLTRLRGARGASMPRVGSGPDAAVMTYPRPCRSFGGRQVRRSPGWQSSWGTPEHRPDGAFEHEVDPWHHHDHPGPDHHPQHDPLVTRTLGPEVDEDHPDPVQRVKHHGPDKADPHQVHERGRVRLDDRVVTLR